MTGLSSVVPGYDGKVTRHFVMHSDDEGQTRSAPSEVTRMVKPATAQATSQDAGNGIQLMHGAKKGRVLIPIWQRIGGEPKVETFAYTAISDDGGETWHHSQPSRCRTVAVMVARGITSASQHSSS
ncbi:MAG: hypothetical protein ACKODB_02905 [Betaproteobacteria bacterium]